jgi:tetratricopeptide (TPR) repeat protein
MSKEFVFSSLRVASLLVSFCMFAAGQDLGTASGLYKGTSSKKTTTSSSSSSGTSSSAKKKTTAKPKPEPVKTTAKKSSPSKKESPKPDESRTASSKSPKAAPSTQRTKTGDVKIAKNTTTVKPPVPKPSPNNIVINVGKPTSGNFDELFEQSIDDGNQARDDRNYTQAETAYRRAQSLKPKDSRAVYGLGNLYSDQQRWEEAEKAYRQAIQIEPTSPEAHIALSFVLTQPVVGAELASRYVEAESMARKALQFDPENAVAYDQLGVSMELRGVIGRETEEAYRKAIQKAPTFALAYAHLGRLLRRNGKTNESAAAYREAVKLSTDVPTMILVAEVMQSQQKFFESEQLLRAALKEDSKNPTGLFLLGRALTTRGDFNQAETVLKKCVDVSPNSFVSYVQLASLYSRRNNYADAEKTLMKALNVVSLTERKRLAQEFERIGDGFVRISKLSDAARVYRQAASLDGDRPDLQVKLNKTLRAS